MKQNTLLRSCVLAVFVSAPLAGFGADLPKSFEPVVIYQDSDYISKHSKSASPSVSAADSAVNSSDATAETAAPSKPSADGFSQFYPVGGVALALVAFAFLSGRGKKSDDAGASVVESVQSAPAASGHTGVARYMASNGIAVKATGVASYISQVEGAERLSAPATGVSRYIKNQGLS